MKQTAVEWLQQQLKDGVKYNPLEKNGYSNAEQRLFEQAKQMEMEQKKEDFIAGMKFIAVDPNKYEKDAEQYYKETYNNNDRNSG